jgi:hypothetical protein
LISELQRLRKERDHLVSELGTLTVSHVDHENARDGVDYKYMRAVRIQQIDRKIKSLLRDNIVKVVDNG